ncbi:class I SAM-dependent methyltransferase [Thiorhodovibrio frisius]|nr:class I SAM-dependent methyltransferase [Thiorhodovibrio frisius]
MMTGNTLQPWRAARLARQGQMENAIGLLRHTLRQSKDRSLLARTLLSELCCPATSDPSKHPRPAPPAPHGLRLGLELGFAPDRIPETPKLTADAELHHQAGRYREAAQCWQDVADLLQEDTPESVYRQLSEAMARNTQGFGGTRAENHTWGDCHKHDLLSWLHAELDTQRYLEIGVDAGLSLARAPCAVLGIDPRPELKLAVALSEQAQINTQSSDAFFREQAASRLQPAPDLVFIDGMHLFEFALRDFINVERHAAPHTLVVIDDIYPCHPTQAARHRRSDAWTGDIWKLHRILQDCRPDLTLVALNAYTTGLLLIAGLDPQDRVLPAVYAAQARRYLETDTAPAEVLAREGAIPSDHALVKALVAVLKQARLEAWSVAQVRAGLAALQPALSAAQQAYQGRAEAGIGQCQLLADQRHWPVAVQLFLPQAEAPHHREQASLWYWIKPGRWERLRFALPTEALSLPQPLRLDPAERPCRLHIRALRVLCGEQAQPWWSAEHDTDSAQAFAALRVQGDAVREASERELVITSTGTDPQLLLPVLAPANGAELPTGPCWLEVELLVEVEPDDPPMIPTDGV